MAIEDSSARIEVVMFSEVYEDAREHLFKGNLLVVQGEVSADDYSGGYKITATRVLSLGQARNEFARCLLLSLDSKQFSTAEVDELKQLLEPFKGGHCPVCIKVETGEARAKLLLDKTWKVRVVPELVASLKERLGDKAVEVAY